jgi:hypothetical protein
MAVGLELLGSKQERFSVLYIMASKFLHLTRRISERERENSFGQDKRTL